MLIYHFRRIHGWNVSMKYAPRVLAFIWQSSLGGQGQGLQFLDGASHLPSYVVVEEEFSLPLSLSSCVVTEEEFSLLLSLELCYWREILSLELCCNWKGILSLSRIVLLLKGNFSLSLFFSPTLFEILSALSFSLTFIHSLPK